MNAANNEISELPEELSQLANIKELYFFNNKIEGSIPSFLGNISTLERISMDGNFLSGTVPSTFNNLDNIQSLDFQRNAISGPLPSLNTNVAWWLRLLDNRFSFSDILQIPSIDLNPLTFGSEQKYTYEITASNLLPQIGESCNISLVEETDGDYILEWYKNGQLIVGATSSTLSLTNIDEGG